MIDVAGTVEATTGSCVTVALAVRTGCGACDSGSGCGLGSLLCLFARGGQRRLQIPLDVPGKFKAGDRVRLAISGEQLSGLAAAAYGLPLLGLFFGACIASMVVPDGGDAAAAAGAVVGAAAGWIALRLCGLDRGLQEALQAALGRSA
jgi:positive regulator of sigma E activity